MRRLLTPTVLLIAAAVALVQGRSQATPSPVFDVAVIKKNKSGDVSGAFGGPASSFISTNSTLRDFVVFAYDVRPFQIEKAPDWVTTDRWDINAKADGVFPPPIPGRPDPRRQMLRALLVDRFKLVTHTESRQFPIYALTMSKGDRSLGPNIQRSDTDCAAAFAAILRGPSPTTTSTGLPICRLSSFPPGRLAAGTVPLQQIVSALSQILQRTVVDRTGLSGNYDVLLTWTPDQAPTAPVGRPDTAPFDPNGPSVFTAIQEQLGMKLESTKGPVEVLVIDHVEKPTSD